MAQRFYDIDFASLTPPEAIDPLDYEVILDERKARFLELWDEARAENPDLPAYDTLVLETDPVAVLLQESAYRELVLRQMVNDRYLDATLPYAVGSALDVLGTLYGVQRQDGETDERFRRRVQLAPEALSTAGTVGGYIYFALSAEPTLLDVDVRKSQPGRVEVTCRAVGTDPRPSAAILSAVRERLIDEGVAPLTDMVTVRAPSVVRATVTAELIVSDTPTKPVIVAEAKAALNTYIESRMAIGSVLYRSGITAALHVPGVVSVNLIEPSYDVAPSGDQAGVVLVEVINVTAARA
ncbi:baseplate assembly protein [Acuticoccus sediminis]|uniref:Baseplate assembly protein n=1 Tax=Acuticoccus sediminis TaxID=2184697 RepID=A0A8B2NS25_9HYPH|nr:baseplate J/gp47 family protein [Acuticoccus sediminis]RAI01100.1 baseplate assembly protein [Acuticoccus sediminis]